MAEDDTDDLKDRIAALEEEAERQSRVPEPRRNWSAYAAVIASLIGILALAVSGYTAYLQRQQLRAQLLLGAR